MGVSQVYSSFSHVYDSYDPSDMRGSLPSQFGRGQSKGGHWGTNRYSSFM